MLFTPEAAPASRGSTLRIASVDIGATTHPTPRPVTAVAGTNRYQGVAGPATSTIATIPAAYSESPAISRCLPPIRSDSRPAKGPVTIDTSDDGASTRPAFSALMCRTDCRYRLNGSTSPSIAIDTSPTSAVITVKFRSRNSANGTRGSRSCRPR